MIWAGQAGTCEVATGADGRFYRVSDTAGHGPIITAIWGKRHGSPRGSMDFGTCKRRCDHFETHIAALTPDQANRVFSGGVLSDDRAVAAWHRNLDAAFWAAEFAR